MLGLRLSLLRSVSLRSSAGGRLGSLARLGVLGIVALAVPALGLAIHLGHPASDPHFAAIDGKRIDRLAFVEEDVPVRDTRIYDTLAMFSLPVSDSAAWSAAPLAPIASAEPLLGPVATAPQANTRTAVPRMVAAATPAAPRQTLVQPPPRVAAGPVAQAPITQASLRIEPAVQVSEPIRIVGWELPGSEHLPDRRDAAKVVDAVGTRASAVGSGAVQLVSSGAGLVGGVATSAGQKLGSLVGWR